MSPEGRENAEAAFLLNPRLPSTFVVQRLVAESDLCREAAAAELARRRRSHVPDRVQNENNREAP